MTTIIYIEDSKQDYKAIFDLLSKKYKVIPANDSEFDQMSRYIANNEIWGKFLKPKIIENQETLGLIMMDLDLGNTEIQGDELIYSIRNELTIPGKYFLPKLIPIISFTKFTGEEFANNALRNGATHNIPKDIVLEYKDGKVIGLEDHIHFKSIVSSIIGYYNTAYFNRSLNEWMHGISSDLEYQGKLIKSRFDNLEILIQGNHEEILQKFDLLFNSIFESFNTDTKRRIFESFKDELSKTLKPESINKLSQSIWYKIKEEIKEVKNGGGFKAFVDTSYDILNEAGILDGKVKLIGIAIKGIFGILA